MKLLCLILSVYIISLAAKPCCDDNDCYGKIEAKKELSNKTSSNEKECPGCSPFFTCGTCTGFIIAKRFTVALPDIAENQLEHSTAYNQPHIEKVTRPIWLPPKIS